MASEQGKWLAFLLDLFIMLERLLPLALLNFSPIFLHQIMVPRDVLNAFNHSRFSQGLSKDCGSPVILAIDYAFEPIPVI